MIATNQNLLSKIGKMAKAGLSSAFLLICFMVVVTVSETQAQSLVQGQEAVTRVKTRYSSVSAANCVYPAPNGTPHQVASRANQLRCEYLNDVHGALTTTLTSTATLTAAKVNNTTQALNEAYERLIARHPGSPSLEAATLLRNELTDLLKS